MVRFSVFFFPSSNHSIDVLAASVNVAAAVCNLHLCSCACGLVPLFQLACCVCWSTTRGQQLPKVSKLTKISPPSGMAGAKVTIHGVYLTANGNGTISESAVTLNGARVERVVSHEDDKIVVIAGHAKPGVGDAVLTCGNGEKCTLPDAWEQIKSGLVEVFTETGFFGEEVVIKGKKLLGGGAKLFKVTLAGIEAEILKATNTKVTVRAGQGKQHTRGVVELESVSGVKIRSKEMFLYTFDVHEAKRKHLDNGLKTAGKGKLRLEKSLRQTVGEHGALSAPPTGDVFFRSDKVDVVFKGLTFAGSGGGGGGGGASTDIVESDEEPEPVPEYRKTLVLDEPVSNRRNTFSIRRKSRRPSKKAAPPIRGGNKYTVSDDSLVSKLKAMFSGADVEDGVGIPGARPDQHLGFVEMNFRVDCDKLLSLLTESGAIAKLDGARNIKAIFKRMDTNNDGKVSMGEFLEFALRSLHSPRGGIAVSSV